MRLSLAGVGLLTLLAAPAALAQIGAPTAPGVGPGPAANGGTAIIEPGQYGPKQVGQYGKVHQTDVKQVGQYGKGPRPSYLRQVDVLQKGVGQYGKVHQTDVKQVGQYGKSLRLRRSYVKLQDTGAGAVAPQPPDAAPVAPAPQPPDAAPVAPAPPPTMGPVMGGPPTTIEPGQYGPKQVGQVGQYGKVHQADVKQVGQYGGKGPRPSYLRAQEPVPAPDAGPGAGAPPMMNGGIGGPSTTIAPGQYGPKQVGQVGQYGKVHQTDVKQVGQYGNKGHRADVKQVGQYVK